ncbi:MAG TPA: hypothetical protein VF595_16515 [Tepidisphaeraceae bacterium]
MLRWLERLAAAFVVLMAVGVLLLCWMPAYVGTSEILGRGMRERPATPAPQAPPRPAR